MRFFYNHVLDIYKRVIFLIFFQVKCCFFLFFCYICKYLYVMCLLWLS